MKTKWKKYKNQLTKTKHTETNNTITEIKNTLEAINSRLFEVERISELEDKMVEITSKSKTK